MGCCFSPGLTEGGENPDDKVRCRYMKNGSEFYAPSNNNSNNSINNDNNDNNNNNNNSTTNNNSSNNNKNNSKKDQLTGRVVKPLQYNLYSSDADKYRSQTKRLVKADNCDLEPVHDGYGLGRSNLLVDSSQCTLPCETRTLRSSTCPPSLQCSSLSMPLLSAERDKPPGVRKKSVAHRSSTGYDEFGRSHSAATQMSEVLNSTNSTPHLNCIRRDSGTSSTESPGAGIRKMASSFRDRKPMGLTEIDPLLVRLNRTPQEAAHLGKASFKKEARVYRAR
ncbi:hypothetical protein DIPPA_70115 [Diplonema papillatum]|nr:hypothetical protein DIPPA_70115 [Diplonema papillatum]